MRERILPSDKFWVVTKNIWGHAELGDVFFSCDLRSLMLQTLGGLKYEDVVGIFFNEEEAKARGEAELHKNTAEASVDLTVSDGEKFFVVTKAGEKSALSDVLTEATVASLQDMIRGGADIYGIYSDRSRAMDAARETLRAEVGKEHRASMEAQRTATAAGAPLDQKRMDLAKTWARSNNVSDAALNQLLSIVSGEFQGLTPIKALYVDSLKNKTYIARNALGRVFSYNQNRTPMALQNVLFSAPRGTREEDLRIRLSEAKSPTDFINTLKTITRLNWTLDVG